MIVEAAIGMLCGTGVGASFGAIAGGLALGLVLAVTTGDLHGYGGNWTTSWRTPWLRSRYDRRDRLSIPAGLDDYFLAAHSRWTDSFDGGRRISWWMGRRGRYKIVLRANAESSH